MNDFVPDGWKSVTLDDVAEERSDRIDNPSQSGYDRFVGLDHLDSGDLTVRRWGSTADLLSAMKLFKSGDILIGRRNAYLKRASRAEFEGVCSGDAYVVREKKGKIAEGLLPIILNSDSFWDYTIAHASGTMSKRAKWRDLAEYTFHLPSLEEQRRIATTLWAAEDCIVKGERFVAAAERAKQLLMKELFSKGIGNKEFKNVKHFGEIPKNWEIVKLDDIAERASGHTPSKRHEEYWNGGVKWVSLADSHQLNQRIINDTTKNISEEGMAHSSARYLPQGTVIMLRGSSVGKCSTLGDRMTVSQDYVAWICSEKIHNFYLYYYLYNLKEEFNRIALGSTIPTIGMGFFSNFVISLPPLPEQRQIASILTRCDETIAAARANVGAAKALKMKMINEMLAPQKN